MFSRTKPRLSWFMRSLYSSVGYKNGTNGVREPYSSVGDKHGTPHGVREPQLVGGL